MQLIHLTNNTSTYNLCFGQMPGSKRYRLGDHVVSIGASEGLSRDKAAIGSMKTSVNDRVPKSSSIKTEAA